MDTEKDALGGQAPAKPGRVSRKPKEDSQSPGRQRRTRKPETDREADNKGGDFFSSDLPKKLALLLVITLPVEGLFTDASVSSGACIAILLSATQNNANSSVSVLNSPCAGQLWRDVQLMRL